MLTLNNNKILTEISNHFSVNSKQHIRLIGFALKEFNQLCRLDQSDATKRSQLKKEKIKIQILIMISSVFVIVPLFVKFFEKQLKDNI